MQANTVFFIIYPLVKFVIVYWFWLDLELVPCYTERTGSNSKFCLKAFESVRQIKLSGRRLLFSPVSRVAAKCSHLFCPFLFFGSDCQLSASASVHFATSSVARRTPSIGKQLTRSPRIRVDQRWKAGSMATTSWCLLATRAKWRKGKQERPDSLTAPRLAS